jgi:hypothetical protein
LRVVGGFLEVLLVLSALLPMARTRRPKVTQPVA